MSALTDTDTDKFENIANQAEKLASLNALAFMKKNTKYQELLRARNSRKLTNNLVLAGIAAVTVASATVFSWYLTFVGMAAITMYFFTMLKKERAISYEDDLKAMMKEGSAELKAFLQNFIFAKYEKVSPLTSFGVSINHDDKVPLRESVVLTGKHITHGHYREVIVTLVFNDTLTSLNAITYQFSDLGKR